MTFGEISAFLACQNSIRADSPGKLPRDLDLTNSLCDYDMSHSPNFKTHAGSNTMKICCSIEANVKSWACH